MDLRNVKKFIFLLALCFASDVCGTKKKVGSMFSDPFLMRGLGRSKKGFIPDLLDKLIGQGTYKFIQPPDGHYGAPDNRTGSWDGIIGMALNGQIEMIAADLTITAHRSDVLEFTTPYMSARATVLLKKEKNQRGGRHMGSKHRYKHVLEMLDNPNFNFMVVGGGANYKFLEQSKIAYQRQIFQRIQRNASVSLVTSYNEGAERLIETDGHDLGLIADSPGVNYLKSKNCQLYSVGNLGERFYGLAFKRSGSSAAKVARLSTKILELQESGMLPLFISTWFGNDKCHKKVKPNPEPTFPTSSIALPLPIGYGVTVDKAYFGGEGTCNSMKLDVSDIKAWVHDLKREMNTVKTLLQNN